MSVKFGIPETTLALASIFKKGEHIKGTLAQFKISMLCTYKCLHLKGTLGIMGVFYTV